MGEKNHECDILVLSKATAKKTKAMKMQFVMSLPVVTLPVGHHFAPDARLCLNELGQQFFLHLLRGDPTEQIHVVLDMHAR